MRRAIGAIIRGRGPTVEATEPLAGFDVPVVRNGETGCKHHQQLAGAAPEERDSSPDPRGRRYASYRPLRRRFPNASRPLGGCRRLTVALCCTGWTAASLELLFGRHERDTGRSWRRQRVLVIPVPTLHSGYVQPGDVVGSHDVDRGSHGFDRAVDGALGLHDDVTREPHVVSEVVVQDGGQAFVVE